MPEFRFLKTADERLADTLDYAKSKLTAAQFLELSTKVGQLSKAQEQALAKELSLGSGGTTSDDRAANRDARRAKRALVLLSQLYIDDLVARNREKTRIKNLPETSEANLCAELLSWFTDPAADGDAVAAIALQDIAKMPKWYNGNIDYELAIRGAYNQRDFNCYNACVFWAFQAGAISRRYLFNKLNDLDGNHFFPTFTAGGNGWSTIYEADKDRVILDQAHGGRIIVPAGRTVYFETPGKVFGHVACSLGDGRVISQNWVYDFKDDKPRIPVGELPEWTKMEGGFTHICSIRTMIDIKFHHKNGYPRVKVLNADFWDRIPVAER